MKTRIPKEQFSIRGMKIPEPLEHGPKLIRQTRDSLQASQALFAGLLGVTIQSLHNWEHGISKPSGSACRLMTAIRNHPEYWAEQMRALAVPRRAPKPEAAKPFPKPSRVKRK